MDKNEVSYKCWSCLYTSPQAVSLLLLLLLMHIRDTLYNVTTVLVSWMNEWVEAYKGSNHVYELSIIVYKRAWAVWCANTYSCFTGLVLSSTNDIAACVPGITAIALSTAASFSNISSHAVSSLAVAISAKYDDELASLMSCTCVTYSTVSVYTLRRCVDETPQQQLMMCTINSHVSIRQLYTGTCLFVCVIVTGLLYRTFFARSPPCCPWLSTRKTY